MTKQKKNVQGDCVGSNAFREMYTAVDGFSDYMVSNFGQMVRVTKGRGRAKPGQVMIGTTNPKGYRMVQLCKDGVIKSFTIHKLTMLHHGPDCPGNDYIIHHKDGNIKNNHIDNLEWITRKDHAREHRAGYHNKKKLSPKVVWMVLKLSIVYGMTKNEIAELFGISHSSIARIRNGTGHADIYKEFMDNKDSYHVLDYNYPNRTRRYTYGSATA